MSEQKHTPGPWAVETGAFDDAHHCYTPVVTAEARDIATLETAHGDALANARRIVACVNACEGISTETLEAVSEGELHAALIRLRSYKAQRDELAGMLRIFVGAFGEAVDNDDPINGADAVDFIVGFVTDARAAIAKCNQ